MITNNKRLIGIVVAVGVILLIPLIAMQFTTDVNWTPFDFIIAGILLLGAGLLCEMVIRKVTKINHRIAICLVILIALLLLWAELAVGIFGTPFGGT